MDFTLLMEFIEYACTISRFQDFLLWRLKWLYFTNLINLILRALLKRNILTSVTNSFALFEFE